jgi:hypothetical protein
MSQRKTTALAALCVISAAAVTAEQSNTLRMQESTIRREATQKRLPIYPPASLARKASGVAVAAIASAPDGRVVTVDILEAPDDAIGEAMRAALLEWRIPPMTVVGRPEQYGVRGKITFYFRVVSGRGQVLNPEEIPGGPKPEPAGGPPSAGPGTRSGSASRGGAPPPAVPTSVQHEPLANLEIGDVEFKALLTSARPTVLDIRERDEFRRGHRDGAINIPRDELAIRAYVELDRARPVVIDCSNADTRDCHDAARSLIRGVKIAKVLIYLP